MRASLQHFDLGLHPVSGHGVGLDEKELEKALPEKIAPIVFDVAGRENVSDLLSGLAETDFEKDRVEEILGADEVTEDWRVGEAMAESYLVDNNDCLFPWPDGRDERKSGCSLPGADLVGFTVREGEAKFAFGEVKTSVEAKYPPSVCYGRHGLKQQLEDLRDERAIRNSLVLYLGHRAGGADWEARFREASQSYIRDSGDIRLFGLLIRDVPPDEDDLRARVESLAKQCPARTEIKLFAIYLPNGEIRNLATRVTSCYQEGGLS